MKRIITVAIFLLAASLVVFAGGKKEEDITGTVTSVVTLTGEKLVVTVTTDDGTYTVRMTEEEWNAAGLKQGDTITVTGVILEDEGDEIPEIEAAKLVKDGVVTDLKDEDGDDEDSEDEQDAEDEDDSEDEQDAEDENDSEDDAEDEQDAEDEDDSESEDEDEDDSESEDEDEDEPESEDEEEDEEDDS